MPVIPARKKEPIKMVGGVSGLRGARVVTKVEHLYTGSLRLGEVPSVPESLWAEAAALPFFLVSGIGCRVSVKQTLYSDNLLSSELAFPTPDTRYPVFRLN
jgi:hypothetical protein